MNHLLGRLVAVLPLVVALGHFSRLHVRGDMDLLAGGLVDNESISLRCTGTIVVGGYLDLRIGIVGLSIPLVTHNHCSSPDLAEIAMRRDR